MPSEERDPSGFVTSPGPSVYVQVKGTARDDINGLLGLVLSYNLDRQRYLVHMTKSQSTMAFKKENLVRAGFLDTYRAQYQQLTNDPRVKHKVSHYITQCQEWVKPAKLSHVVSISLVVILSLLYIVGITKTIMAISLFVLLGIIAAPDILTKESPRTILVNFPKRSRETMEQHMPMLRGKLSNRMAMGIIICLIALCLQSLLFAGRANYHAAMKKRKLEQKKNVKKIPATTTNTPEITVADLGTMQQPEATTTITITDENPQEPSSTTQQQQQQIDLSTILSAIPDGSKIVLDATKVQELVQMYYGLGFQDATGQGKELDIERIKEQLAELIQQQEDQEQEDLASNSFPLGTTNDNYEESQPPSLLSRLRHFLLYGKQDASAAATNHDGMDENDDDAIDPNKNRSFMSMTNMASMFYLYRTIRELGVDRQTNLFCMAQLFANLHKQQAWRKILLGLSFYNVLRLLLF